MCRTRKSRRVLEQSAQTSAWLLTTWLCQHKTGRYSRGRTLVPCKDAATRVAYVRKEYCGGTGNPPHPCCLLAGAWTFCTRRYQS
jgi:hypothetical protein